MKKLLTFLLIALCFTANAQVNLSTKVDAVKFRSQMSSTERDAVDVPTGEFWLIYNTTLSRLQIGDENENWVDIVGSGGGGGSMTGAEIETVLDAYYGNTDWRTQNPDLTGSEIELILDTYFGNTDWRTNSGGGISSVVEDTTPQLGGSLDAQGNTIDNAGTTFWLSSIDGITKQFAAIGNIGGIQHFYMGEFGGGLQIISDLQGSNGWGFTQLAGTGTRMVVADEDGYLSTQAIPSGGGSFDTAANYTVTGDWIYRGSTPVFEEGVGIESTAGSAQWTVGVAADNTLVFGLSGGSTVFSMRSNGTAVIATDLVTKSTLDAAIAGVSGGGGSGDQVIAVTQTEYDALSQTDIDNNVYVIVDEETAGSGSGSGSSGEKFFTIANSNFTLAATDFSLAAPNEDDLHMYLIEGSINIDVPSITTTSKTALFKVLDGASATFYATSGQLFWIADEDSYVNSFELTGKNIAAITPVNEGAYTLFSVDGSVRGFNTDTTNPGSVSSLSVSNIQTSSVRLTWTHATDDIAVSYYEISTDDVSYSNIGYVTEYDLTGLSTATSGTAYIRAVDASGNTGSSESVGFTTAANLTLLTDSNTNTDIFSNGAGSFVTDDTGLYTSGVGDHLDPVNVQTQQAVLATVNGSTYVHEVISDGTEFSRIRARFANATTQGSVYQYDFIYRMTGGGQYGAVNIDGVSHTGLSSPDWTVISGESTAGGTSLDVDVYASNNASASAGEGIQWKLIVKAKEIAVVDYTPLTGSNANPQIIDNGPGAWGVFEDTTDYNGSGDHNSAIGATISAQPNTELNGNSYVSRVVGTLSNGTSRVRPIFSSPNTGTEVFQYDFTYRMVQGSHGRIRAKGFALDIQDLAETEWTTISGEFSAPSNGFDLNVYADGGGGNVGDIIEWKLSVKLKED